MRIRNSGLPALLLAAALGLGGCQQVNTTSAGALGVTRQQTMLLSSAEVDQSSAQAYRAEIGKARAAGKLNTDPKLDARVRHIAARLIAKTPVFRPDAARWQWETNVIGSSEVNAYAMAGGKIGVYSGLVSRLGLTDDELAAVMGHEIAHALREHSREKMSRAYAQQMGLGLVGALAGLNQGQMQVAGSLAEYTLALPNSREMESEADVMGLELMARAGYDPRAAVSVWRKMQALGGGEPPAFMSTHPSSSSRIEELSARIPRVMPLYEAARRGG